MAQPLGVILSQFPRYDEAFILRELVALAQGPRPLVIFSLRPCHDRVIHDQARSLQLHTVYAPFFWSAALWRSHAHFLRRRPGAYVGALGWLIGRHWRHPLILLKSLVLFPKAVHFARLARQRGIAHLHAFWATYPASVAIVIQRLTGIAYSLSGHAHDIYTANPALAEKIGGARFTLTCTEANQRHLESLLNGHRMTAGPIIVSYHGVDLTRFAAMSKPAGSTCRLLAVGSLLPCKGLETLVEACRVLQEQGADVQCTIAGGGPLDGALRRLVARHGLQQRVEITGFIDQQTVAGLYQQAHLVALPLVSRMHWGIPNVLIEALATKTPVICCDLPSLKELVVHGHSGWVIPEDNPQALARAVGALWRDAELRRQMGEAGYQRVVERFALERTGQRLRAIFAAHAAPAEPQP